MNKNEKTELWRYWRGLGAWNYYYLLKFTLLWLGYLNFHALDNLIFAAFLLFPLASARLHRWRNIVALPIGFVVFYNDTWLPGLNSIRALGSQVDDFSAGYLLELLNRFINWQWVGAAFVLLVAYLFIAQWLRITVFTVAVLIGLNVMHIGGPMFSLGTVAPVAASTPAMTAPTATASAPSVMSAPPTNQ